MIIHWRSKLQIFILLLRLLLCRRSLLDDVIASASKHFDPAADCFNFPLAEGRGANSVAFLAIDMLLIFFFLNSDTRVVNGQTIDIVIKFGHIVFVKDVCSV